jgi:hypothetical protein
MNRMTREEYDHICNGWNFGSLHDRRGARELRQSPGPRLRLIAPHVPPVAPMACEQWHFRLRLTLPSAHELT